MPTILAPTILWEVSLPCTMQNDRGDETEHTRLLYYYVYASTKDQAEKKAEAMLPYWRDSDGNKTTKKYELDDDPHASPYILDPERAKRDNARTRQWAKLLASTNA